jgi:hypothetical protein
MTMKLTIKQVEATMTAAWGREAIVVPYRLAGNLYSYAVTDHQEHWLLLLTSWAGGHQVFEPVDGTWPELVPSPEPGRMTWGEAVLEAMQLAYAYFGSREDSEALKRLPRAQAIATRQNWRQLGDKLNTWLIPSSTTLGRVYKVNGRCTCKDFQGHGIGWWCKHRLARALARRAAELLKNGNGAGSDSDTPAPHSMGAAMNNGTDSTTTSPNGQARRIELVMAYEAEEAKVLPHINGNGQLVEFKADGRLTEPPVKTTPELYRWLQANGYVPTDFKWRGWEHGLRQRRQTYVLADARDTALPVQHSRGRSKLFKGEAR